MSAYLQTAKSSLVSAERSTGLDYIVLLFLIAAAGVFVAAG